MEKNLIDYLKKHSINYILHKHGAVFTVAESKKDPSIMKIPGIRSKNLFLKDEQRKYYLVCLPGEKRLDIKHLKAILKTKELHFASPAELKHELNLTPGSVSIFGMLNSKNTELIIDEDIWAADSTGFHPNINTETLEIKNQDLKNFISSLNCKKTVLKL